MIEKRFKLKVNQHGLCDIVDLVESKEKNAICIYNDLGNYYFSSAKALCELMNELQMKCDKKQEHIVVLENKIRRMREAIHKLEWLASHRNADLMRENKQLKFQNSNLMKEVAEYSRKAKELENGERKTEKEKSCGTCKHYQLDGMFGTWCDLGRDWINVKYCSDWER